MKKILLATALVLAIGLSVSAQDGFFRGGDIDMDRSTSISGTTPALPRGTVGSVDADQPAPLGSGLLVLTALGAGYAAYKKRR